MDSEQREVVWLLIVVVCIAMYNAMGGRWWALPLTLALGYALWDVTGA